MSRDRVIDVCAWCLILAWVGGSVALAAFDNWPLFQSFGAFGICIGVIYFAAQRHAAPHAIGAIEANAQVQRHLTLLGDNVACAHANNALLAKALLFDQTRTGAVPNSVLLSLSSTPAEEIEAALKRRAPSYDPVVARNEAASLQANSEVIRRHRIAEITQATIVVLGTLQGGFGQFLQGLL